MWLNKLLTVGSEKKAGKRKKFPGVKGGRARLILVDTQVCEFIQNTPAFHNTPMLMEAEERIAEYAPGARAPAYRQIINAIDNMTDIEQEKVAQFLSREGIRNFLARLDIDESA
ncbi:putative regulatory protein [Escherichia coli]|nr:putative regulatory protein [Escherichia coli]